MSEQIELNLFKPRPYQREIFEALDNGYRKIICVLPRRAGKDITAWNLSIQQCIKKVCLVQYVLPTFGQARRCIFDAISSDGLRFLDYIPKQLVDKVNVSEQKIVFVNGSVLQCLGGDVHDTSIRGTNPYLVVLSEYAYMHESVFDTVRPILAANGGRCIFLSTPYGKNHFWQMIQSVKELPDWKVILRTTDEIKHIPQEALEQERAQMSPELFAQEYECFPSGAGVLTSLGILPIEQVKVNDLVVSHSGRMRKVMRVMNKHYSGELIEIKSYGSTFPIICTPEHPIRIYDRKTQSYSWKKAELIIPSDRVVFPKMYLDKDSIISYELCMLMAWYITEGSGGKNFITFSVGKEKERDRVVFLLDALHYSYKVSIDINGCININVNSSYLLDFFKVQCGVNASNKRIPFSFIGSYEKDFFFELISGDGCFNVYDGHEKYSYSTISKSLAYQVQLLAHSLDMNFSAGITVTKELKETIQGRVVNCKQSYNVQIIARKNGLTSETKMLRAKNSIAAAIMSINKLYFDGPVYNLSVQWDSSYIVEGRAVHNCSFERGVSGSVFGTCLDDIKRKGQVTSVSWDPSLLVYVAIDIGVNDPTTLIFFQVVGDGVVIKVIDCYSNRNVGLDHYAHYLQQKPYRYGKYFAPPDLMVREWGGGAITRYEKARQLDIKFDILDQIDLEDSIENVMANFPKIWIDADKCKSLINALENYYKEWDEQKQIYKPKPVHNWSSHYADAFRYMCQAIYKTKKGLTSEEFERKKAEARYGPHHFVNNPFFNSPGRNIR